jgi:hypothetical protein
MPGCNGIHRRRQLRWISAIISWLNTKLKKDSGIAAAVFHFVVPTLTGREKTWTLFFRLDNRLAVAIFKTQ